MAIAEAASIKAFARGTEGSNPAPSRRESSANLTADDVTGPDVPNRAAPRTRCRARLGGHRVGGVGPAAGKASWRYLACAVGPSLEAVSHGVPRTDSALDAVRRERSPRLAHLRRLRPGADPSGQKALCSGELGGGTADDHTPAATALDYDLFIRCHVLGPSLTVTRTDQI